MTTYFTIPPHLSFFNIPRAEFAASRPEFADFVTNAYIFSTSPTSATPCKPRVLLIQRSLSDSYPGCWEGPGGLCETTDETLLAGVAREVLEETGLHVSRFVDLVSVEGWVKVRPEGVRRAVQYSFIVEVHESQASGWEDAVRLDPAEHEDFVWVTQEEVRDGMQQGKFMFIDREEGNLFAAMEIFERLSVKHG
ncbi:hypothetical protein ASPWEDRAFT_27234 [Aspergillus wentii DTO 134E9]|uniref:Nudix hydrolase domain-containing protein n=1 Tax=Aspergillus wentii DTO 134E9 TaxID=1073089 RepID=A0A1L9RSE9_ASPWE|nr:uncharacterized protein ASPWEDRAFT_27234 [Aspergillus wentii DTO 134E9]KAI9930734.1 hypothetical protein MW887_011491 [Aspergillus wentii]OJJ37906.1 hypothetical protein ASPWEDRAFT_27234 [Aspergillus wentii DTO 134E9]